MNASLTVYLACLSLENAHNTVVCCFLLYQTNEPAAIFGKSFCLSHPVEEEFHG
jgi:hypothetical protein